MLSVYQWGGKFCFATAESEFGIPPIFVTMGAKVYYMKKLFYFSLLIILSCNLAAKADQEVKVVIDTTKTFTQDVSRNDANISLLQFARQCALEKAIPATVSISSLTTDMYVNRNKQFDEETARSIFVNSSAAGHFLKESKKIDKIQDTEDFFTLRIRYEATIRPRSQDKDPSLYLDMDISDNTLKSGDEFTLRLKASKDGYLYIFNFLSDNSVVLIYPTLVDQANALRTGQIFERKIGVLADPGRKTTIETLYAVFSTVELAGWQQFKTNADPQNIVFSAGEESFALFQNWLSRARSDQFDEKMAQIHISKPDKN